MSSCKSHVLFFKCLFAGDRIPDRVFCILVTCSGSGIFNSSNPEAYARAIVEATTHYNDPLKIAEVSTGLGAGMKGENDLNREGLVSKCLLLDSSDTVYGHITE